MGNSNTLEAQLKGILSEYNERVGKAVEESAQQVSKECVNKLKSSSPRKTGDYASGWGIKRMGSKDFVVHNKTEYRLTHLLENGHVSRNQFGTFGRVRAIPHIKPVEQWANDEFTNQVEKKIGGIS